MGHLLRNDVELDDQIEDEDMIDVESLTASTKTSSEPTEISILTKYITRKTMILFIKNVLIFIFILVELPSIALVMGITSWEICFIIYFF